MRWYINDASLQGQFNSMAEFEPTLRSLIDLRKTEPAYSSLFVTRLFGRQNVTPERTLAHAVQELSDRDFKVRVLQWVSQRGPFVDDDRLSEENDYFECLGVDVTNQGLGEATRRVARKLDAGSWSFAGGTVDFLLTPLKVAHGLREERYGEYDIRNVWDADGFRAQALASFAEPTSWATLLDRIRLQSPLLQIPDSTFENPGLIAEPYSTAIADRVIELCSHLNNYMESRNADGSESARTTELIRDLFSKATGAEPLFTGESSTNQKVFEKELTFLDPDNPSQRIFAHWHGKIRHRFFRMHFEWPVPRTCQRLKILYLGPKITRD